MIPLIERELDFGPSTIHELSEVIGISKRNIRHYLGIMREESRGARRVFICGYEVRTGPAAEDITRSK